MIFKPLNYLEDAVNRKDVKDIRIAILSYIKKCLGDTQEIDDAINYIKNELTEKEYNNIWEKHDGLNLNSDKSNWNKTYFSSVEVDLSDNFSQERFNHILEVGRHVYGTTKPIKSTLNKNTSTSTNNKNKEKYFLSLILVGGVVLLLGIGISMVIKMMKK